MSSAALLLVLNAGSSSIKFALFDVSSGPPARQAVWSGKADGITTPHATFSETGRPAEPLALAWIFHQ